MILAQSGIPSTGNPVVDGFIIAILLAFAVAAALRDKYVGSMKKKLVETEELLTETTNELVKTREQNVDLYRRLHQKDIEIAEMRGRTDFEPVRTMLKELVANGAITAQLMTSLADKLTISIKETSELRGSVEELINHLRQDKLAQFQPSIITERKA